MISVSTKKFGQLDVVLRDVMLEMRYLLEVLIRSDILNYMLYTEEVCVQLWIFLKT